MSTSLSAVRTGTAVLGITSTLVLSGIHIGTSLLFVPHLRATTTRPTATADNPAEPIPSARIFDGLYTDGAKTVVPLAATGILSFAGLAASSWANSKHYLSPSLSVRAAAPAVPLALAAGLVASTLVWTGIVVMPINNRLVGLARGTAKGSDERGEVAALLRRWGRVNYVRGFAALAAGVLALGAVVVA